MWRVHESIETKRAGVWFFLNPVKLTWNFKPSSWTKILGPRRATLKDRSIKYSTGKLIFKYPKRAKRNQKLVINNAKNQLTVFNEAATTTKLWRVVPRKLRTQNEFLIAKWENRTIRTEKLYIELTRRRKQTFNSKLKIFLER